MFRVNLGDSRVRGSANLKLMEAMLRLELLSSLPRQLRFPLYAHLHAV
jgi:hypothetical protein